MFFHNKDKPRERFYLLPGQGGQNHRRKQRLMMRWAIVVALIFGAMLAGLLWWLAKLRF